MSASERAFVRANIFEPLRVHEYFRKLDRKTPKWAIAMMNRAESEVNGLFLGVENMLARGFRELALKGVGGAEVQKLFFDFVKLASLIEVLPPWQPKEYELYKRTKTRRTSLLTQWRELERKYKFKLDINDYSSKRLELFERDLKDINK